MTPLETLKARLEEAMSGRPRQHGWGDLPALRRSLEATRLAFGDTLGIAREARIVQGVMAFRLQGERVDFVRLKYACLGLARPLDWEARRLLEDERLTRLLLQRVAALRDDPRRFGMCCRNLLTALEQATAEETPPSAAVARNLGLLRRFLGEAARDAAGDAASVSLARRGETSSPRR
ncbi:MAG: hypothetical protein LBO79_05540 [Zoogloeaceae bacterium]|jgi:hypothetical protein|nr:hypothetical protein [Zoogloeaceae bacterium]